MSVYIYVTESECDSRQLDRIEQKLETIVNQNKQMSKQQEQHDALVDEILAGIQTEVGQIKEIVGTIQEGKPISLDKLRSLKAAVEAMSDAVSPTTEPAEGRHNITFGFRSTGEENFSVNLVTTNGSDERAAEVRGMYDASVAAGQAQASGGEGFNSTWFYSDNGQQVSTDFNNEAQKAAADVAATELLHAAALAQLAKHQPNDGEPPVEPPVELSSRSRR